MRKITPVFLLVFIYFGLMAMEQSDERQKSEYLAELAEQVHKWDRLASKAQVIDINAQSHHGYTLFMRALKQWHSCELQMIAFCEEFYKRSSAELLLRGYQLCIEPTVSHDPVFIKFLAMYTMHRLKGSSFLQQLLQRPGIELTIGVRHPTALFEITVLYLACILEDSLPLQLIIEHNEKNPGINFNQEPHPLEMSINAQYPGHVKLLAKMECVRVHTKFFSSIRLACKGRHSFFKMHILYLLKEQGAPLDLSSAEYSALSATFVAPLAKNWINLNDSLEFLSLYPRTPDSEVELTRLENHLLLLGAQWPDDDGISARKRRLELSNFLKNPSASAYCALASKLGPVMFEKAVRELLGAHNIQKFTEDLMESSIQHFQSRIADVNASDMQGITPLLWAAARGNTKLGRALLTLNHTDPNSCDRFGNSALHYSVLNGHIPMSAELLSDPRISISQKNLSGARPYDIAQFHKNESMLALFNALFRELKIRKQTLAIGLWQSLPWELCIIIARLLCW